MAVKCFLFVLCFLDASTVKLSVIKSVAVESETCAALSIALIKNPSLQRLAVNLGSLPFNNQLIKV